MDRTLAGLALGVPNLLSKKASYHRGSTTTISQRGVQDVKGTDRVRLCLPWSPDRSAAYVQP
jgi:hypothetical protein